jgi:putative chitinase
MLSPQVLKKCMPSADIGRCTTFAPAFESAAAEFGINTPEVLAAWLASMANESGQLKKVEEDTYFTTDRSRMVAVFGARAPSEAQLATWRAMGRQRFDENFFDFLYDDRNGATLGNDQDGDGFRYRGLGPGQITGKGNYKAVGDRIGVNLLAEPNKLRDDPVTGARAFAAYFVMNGIDALAADGSEGGFLRAMKKMNPGLSDAEFRTHHLVRWHEVQGGLGLTATAELDIRALQQALIDAGFPLPKFGADGDFGNETRTALRAFQLAKGLPVTGAPDKATRAALGM